MHKYVYTDNVHVRSAVRYAFMMIILCGWNTEIQYYIAMIDMKVIEDSVPHDQWRSKIQHVMKSG